MDRTNRYHLVPIGVVRTPYQDGAPYQPVASNGVFFLELDPRYQEGLRDLDRFRYIYVIAHAHKVQRRVAMTVSPPWGRGKTVGLFASRSPARPNPIVLSIVRLERIEGNRIYTSGLDLLDGTPLLDIKPYVQDLDNKPDANYGWLDDLEDREHLALHIRGIPHD